MTGAGRGKADRVGHTAAADAVIHAVEVLDREVGRVVAAAEECGYSVLITADHGNVEQMMDPASGQVHTAHTTNPVPLILVDPDRTHIRSGVLGDVAPTLLDILGITPPEAMTRKSLLRDA